MDLSQWVKDLVSPAAAALIQPLAQELLYATGAALKRQTKNKKAEVSVVAQWLTNPTRNLEVAGSILASLSGLKDLALL